MPFSFKPEQTGGFAPSESSQPATSPAPTSSPAPTTMSFTARGALEEKGVVDLLMMGIFGLSVATLVVLFGYHYYLASGIESKKAELASYETKLSSLPINDIRKLSNRLKVVNQLVKEHPSINTAFRILEDSVENPVTYKRFDLRYSDNFKIYELVLGAVAPNYRSVAEQMDTFKRKPYNTYIPDVNISEVRLDENGQVLFSIKMPIRIAGVMPEELLLESDAVVPQIDTSTSSTMSSTTTQATTTPNAKQP